MKTRNDTTTSIDETALVLPANTTSKKIKVAQAITCIMGSGSIMLYAKPSERCTQLATCGLWLANYTSKDAAFWLLFFNGGLDFAATNVYFAAYSIPRFTSYMAKQPTTWGKIKKGSALAAFAGIQIMQPLTASLGSNAATWQTLVTMLGFAPGVLYSSINLAETNFPYVSGFYRRVTVSDENQIARNRHYQAQQRAFNADIAARWQQIEAHAGTVDLPDEKNYLSFLFQQPAQEDNSSLISASLRVGSTLAGVLAGSSFLIPLILNTEHVLEKELPFAASIIGTGIVSASTIYNVMKLMTHGFEAAYDSLHNLVNQQPIPSLAYQLRPKTSVALWLLGLATSSISFATLYMFFYDNYKDTYFAKQEMGIGTIVATDIYHFIGIVHLYNLALQLFTKNPRDQFLFGLQKEVGSMLNLSLNEFARFTENLSEEDRGRYQLATLEEVSDVVDLEEAQVKKKNSGGYATAWFSQWRTPANTGLRVDTQAPLLRNAFGAVG